MIIGFLADKIPFEVRRGWGVYSYELLRALLSLDTDNTYHCLYNIFRKGKRELIVDVPGSKSKNIVSRIPGRLMQLLWERWRVLSVEDIFGKIDIFHSPYEFLPKVKHARTVVTVHDVTFLKHPEYLNSEFVELLTRRIHYIAEKADRIIAVSENTKRELVAHTRLPQDRVIVIREGVNEHFHPIRDKMRIKKIAQRYGITGPYILFVGAADEDKNLLRLAQAFAQLRQEHKDLQLVFAGELSWQYRRLKEQLIDLKVEKGLVFTGFVAYEDLPVLYTGAEVLAMPSIHEGFGLPALEAMACGTPVLCSDVASLPEVVGDAGLLVDPYSVEEIAQGLRRLLRDEDLAISCIEKGLARAKLYTWSSAARRVLEVYRELAQ
ncbi:MAG: glycosyltransferase family 4 protein [Thermodesulfobacteriota bacterium]